MPGRRPGRRSPRRRRGRRTLAAVVGSLLLVAAAVAGVVALLDRAAPRPPVAESCVAEVNGVTARLSPQQSDNAAVIAAVAVRRGLPARAATIALATALQESGLINLDRGDRDSLGLFQQRPSQGWGTAAQVMDPIYATGTFYDRLVKVPDYQNLPITEAAQAVQRSALPDAYAVHEDRSRAWASSLTGWSPAALSCTLRPAGTPGTTDSVLGRASRDLGLTGSVVPTVPAAGTGRTADPVVALDATPLVAGDAARAGWATAQWAVAVAWTVGLDQVAVADQVWKRGTDGWRPTTTGALPPGQVRLTL
ncbi:MAG: hypothetical protein B7X40_10600, partial [Cellulomonas sp. 14-74-6]